MRVRLCCNGCRRIVVSARQRLAQRTLARYGLVVIPIATQLLVQAPSRKFAYISGFEGHEKDELQAKAEAAGSNWIDRECGEAGPWHGHLVGLVEDRWFIDCSIDQASSAEHSFVLPHLVLIGDLGDGGGVRFRNEGGLELTTVDDDGTQVSVQYRVMPNKHEYLDTEAWQDAGLILLAGQIAGEMRKRGAAGLSPGCRRLILGLRGATFWVISGHSWRNGAI